jgi:hypothetical protein
MRERAKAIEEDVTLTAILAIAMTTLATDNAPDVRASIRLSIGAWVDERSHTIETPVEPRYVSQHKGRRTAIYIGLWIGDLVSTEWAIRTPMADGTVFHEGNPFPGMQHVVGRAVLLPAFGLAAAQVDRYLIGRGHARWARAWRWVCWLNEALQTLANFRVTPAWASPMGLLPRAALRSK